MNRRQLFVICLNSTILFLIAYILIFVLTSTVTAISASTFNIPSELTYSEIIFYVRSQDWASDSVKTIFSTGPIVALLTGILLWMLYTRVSEETGILKLLVVWMIAQCIVFFFGDMMMGAIFDKGFGYVVMYLYFMDTGKMIITIIAMVAMLLSGLVAGKQLLFTANTYLNFLPVQNARRFVVVQFLLPFLAGNIMITLLKLPGISLFEIFLNGSMIIFLAPVYLRAGKVQDLYFDEDEKSNKVSWKSILVMIILLVSYRIVFGIGIRF